jgi:hypothetical protein
MMLFSVPNNIIIVPSSIIAAFLGGYEAENAYLCSIEAKPTKNY